MLWWLRTHEGYQSAFPVDNAKVRRAILTCRRGGGVPPGRGLTARRHPSRQWGRGAPEGCEETSQV